MCSRNDPDVRQLYKVRSKTLAHRDRRLAQTGVAASYPAISEEEVERLLWRAQSVLNRYSVLFSASAFGMSAEGQHDVTRVFLLLRQSLEQQRQQQSAEERP